MVQEDNLHNNPVNLCINEFHSVQLSLIDPFEQPSSAERFFFFFFKLNQHRLCACCAVLSIIVGTECTPLTLTDE